MLIFCTDNRISFIGARKRQLDVFTFIESFSESWRCVHTDADGGSDSFVHTECAFVEHWTKTPNKNKNQRRNFLFSLCFLSLSFGFVSVFLCSVKIWKQLENFGHTKNAKGARKKPEEEEENVYDEPKLSFSYSQLQQTAAHVYDKLFLFIFFVLYRSLLCVFFFLSLPLSLLSFHFLLASFSHLVWPQLHSLFCLCFVYSYRFVSFKFSESLACAVNAEELVRSNAFLHVECKQNFIQVCASKKHKYIDKCDASMLTGDERERETHTIYIKHHMEHEHIYSSLNHKNKERIRFRHNRTHTQAYERAQIERRLSTTDECQSRCMLLYRIVCVRTQACLCSVYTNANERNWRTKVPLGNSTNNQ